jgi:hypothetical protein
MMGSACDNAIDNDNGPWGRTMVTTQEVSSGWALM